MVVEAKQQENISKGVAESTSKKEERRKKK